jgi:hypothetical protein
VSEGADKAGWDVIEAGVKAARVRLGDGLVSAYAIGSLGHGGFDPAVSDVDLALLTGDGAAAVDAEAIGRDVRGALPGSELAERLSIFHAPWSRFGAPGEADRFPAIDRRDLMRSGVLVHGEDLRNRFGVEPPDAEVIGNSINSALVRFTAEGLREQVEALTPAAIDPRSTHKLILWPVRLLHTIDTARAAGNDEAADHYRSLADPPPAHLTLVEEALTWRRTGAVADRDAALAMLRAELLPLYAEVYARLRGRVDLPRAEEIAARADELAAVAAG